MQEQLLSSEIISQLSAKERSRIRQRYALHRRYETAVALYADTNTSAQVRYRDRREECAGGSFLYGGRAELSGTPEV